jgi:hypothetical protein
MLHNRSGPLGKYFSFGPTETETAETNVRMWQKKCSLGVILHRKFGWSWLNALLTSVNRIEVIYSVWYRHHPTGVYTLYTQRFLILHQTRI